MAISDLAHSYEGAAQRLPLGPSLTFFAAIAATASVAGTAGRVLSPDHMLPLIAASLFVFAAASAVFGWRQRKARPNAALTYWDVAGALTLIGVCAAALVDPEQMVRVMLG